MSTNQKKHLLVRAIDYTLIVGLLYKRGMDEVLHRCVFEYELPWVMIEAHAGVVGGHYAGKATVCKILQAGIWWPTMHADARDYCRSCDVCQCTGNHPEEMRCYFSTNYTTSI